MELIGYISDVQIVPDRVGCIDMGTASVWIRVIGTEIKGHFDPNLHKVKITIEPVVDKT